MTFDHILLFSQKCNLPTCDSFRSDGSHLHSFKEFVKSCVRKHVAYILLLICDKK